MHLGPGTRALVTGRSRGIGRALAEVRAARGVTVGLAARSERELEALADALPGDHVVLPADVGDQRSIEAAIESFGELHLVVANAGLTDDEPFASQPPERYEEMTRVNWLGTLHTVSAALPKLLRQPAGHVVVVSGAAALRPGAGQAVLAGTLAARRAFADALGQELRSTPVSVTAAFPSDAVPDHRAAERIVRAVERGEREVYDRALTRLGARG